MSQALAPLGGTGGPGDPTKDAPKLQTYHCTHSRPTKFLSVKEPDKKSKEKGRGGTDLMPSPQKNNVGRCGSALNGRIAWLLS